MQPVRDTWMSASGGAAAAAASSSTQHRTAPIALTPAYIRACMPALRDEEDELFAKHRNACAQQMREAARSLKWETIYSMPDTDESDVHVLDAVFDRIVGWLCSEHFVVQPHSSSIRCIVISWDPAANPENISAQERADPNSNAMKRLRAVQRRMRTAATDLPTVHTTFPLQQPQQPQQQHYPLETKDTTRAGLQQRRPPAVFEFDHASRVRSEQIAERAAMVAGTGCLTPELDQEQRKKQPKTPPPPSPPPLRTLSPPPMATVPTPIVSPRLSPPVTPAATSPIASPIASPSTSRVVSPGLSTASDTDLLTVQVASPHPPLRRAPSATISLDHDIEPSGSGESSSSSNSSNSSAHDATHGSDNDATSDAGSE